MDNIYPFQKKTLLFKQKLNKINNTIHKKTTPQNIIKTNPKLLYQNQYINLYQQKPYNTYQKQITTQHLTLTNPNTIKNQNYSKIIYHYLISPQNTIKQPISTKPNQIKQ